MGGKKFLSGLPLGGIFRIVMSRRRKDESLPVGVYAKLRKSGVVRYEGRIRYEGKLLSVGTFGTVREAVGAQEAARTMSRMDREKFEELFPKAKVAREWEEKSQPTVQPNMATVLEAVGVGRFL